MQSILGVIKDKYYFKGKEYSIYKLRDLQDKLNNNRKIIIFDENIFIKKYKFEGKYLEKFVEEKIIDEFSNREELLFHYEYRKKDKIIFLYSIRNIIYNELYKNIKSLEINPIQFWLKSYISKNNKIKNYVAIFKFFDKYYLIDVEDNIIINSYIYRNLDELKKIISEINKQIIIDTLVSDLKVDKAFIEGKAGEKLYEKLCKK
ncbi:hypothetical protein [Caproiciproducens sp. MSJ-32]|uniref:hypothetical protein n=1 Tax=Caproiciproducens sp. MSJ-32 TaxID=2841527 RepID=UPI001C0FE3EB|nr:hypothetical protein [Caproiciproducens sp. MSJ-32]MBU5454589.1 hypothetical protein [Caproiciproducens sp. MSJ-32]